MARAGWFFTLWDPVVLNLRYGDVWRHCYVIRRQEGPVVPNLRFGMGISRGKM